MGRTRQEPPNHVLQICGRLADTRIHKYGPRGQAAFARDLGIAPTSYAHYERDRIAPADILARAARLTGTRLDWLILGEGPREARHRPTGLPEELLAQRLVDLLRRNPRLERSVEEFLQMLEGMPIENSRSPQRSKTPDEAGLIPVIGSTAAGPARYWSELKILQGGRESDAQLEHFLQGHFERSVRSAAPAGGDSLIDPEAVALVQYSRPDEQGFLEFVSAASLRRHYPQSVAWRIDGDSMSPRFRDGDLVITSPDHPAVEMQPCVARQRDQIGVNCKLFRRDLDDVLLIPVNEAYPVQRIPCGQLIWAWRVLSSVRLLRN